MTALTMQSEVDNMSVASFSSHGEMSSRASNSKRTTSSSGKTEDLKRLRKDPWIQSLRFLSLCVLLVVAYVVALTVYVSLKDSEQRAFETKFHDQATQLGTTLRQELAVKLQALDALSVSVSTYAESQMENNWPNISMPEFGFRSASTLKIAKGISVGFHPIVRRDQLNGWQEYAATNQASWRQEGFEFQAAFPEAVPEERREEDSLLNHTPFSDIRSPSEFVFSINEGEPSKYEGDVMVPVWQHSPVDRGLPYINEDQLKDETDAAALEEILENRTAVLGVFYDLSETIYGHEYERLGARYQDSEWEDIWEGDLKTSKFEEANNGDSRRGINPQLQGPATNIWYPVFVNINDAEEDLTLVAVLSLTTKWDAFFLAHLPPDATGLIVVVSNSCGQVFTFDISGGDVTYLGPTDAHDEEYDYYQDTIVLQGEESIYTGTPVSQTYCPYIVDVFPSTKMRNNYATNNPRSFTIGVASIFLFTIIVFIFYDFLVERRQRFLAEAADRSNAIVSSLFPKIVRDRLFDNGDPSEQDKKSQFKNQGKLDAGSLVPSAGPVRHTSAPIADLFTNTTVMFGDIAGFTAWSSARQPSEVFILLETLYGAFDKLAKEMEVFKVETIGDCYMAVTGLPNAQDDHHLRMVRFARHALQKMSVLTSELEVNLGPDTTDLKFRVGLHSGPVTAGVLRGEKSRFQLFGDTVNTASRMESTGKPNLIQVSQTTADLVIASGKGVWLKKRENMVQAKGKGEVQTYWVRSKVASSGKSSDTFENPDEGDTETHVSAGGDMFYGDHSVDGDLDISLGSDNVSDTSNGLEDSFKALGIRKSLIDWQVDVLSRLLKQIVIHRENMSFRSSELPLKVRGDRTQKPRDSIAECIHMPDYGAWNLQDANTFVDNFELPKNVVDQLEDLITAIAQLYRQNSFHNFEHACHVTMSANKLLKRIISPDRKSVDFEQSIRINHDTTFGLASDPLTQFAIIFSAIIHDVDHSGVSNGQLAKEQNRVAVMYNNKSVAEQNSIDLTFEILTSGLYSDLLDSICGDQEEFQRFKQLVINCVMATDIFDKELKDFRNKRWSKAFGNETTNDLKATIVIEHIIQAADVAHTMQHWHVYQRWNEMLFQEMCKAYDAGRGSPNDPADFWYEGELWFFDNYVIPLAKKLDDCGVFGVSSDECLTYALENRNEWEAKGRSIVEELRGKYHPKHVQWEDEGEMI